MIKFPFTSLQQCNLDWIMEQLHKILQFMPLNGAAGDVLQRNADGAAWMPIAAISLDIHSMDALLDPVAGNDELPIYDNSAQGNFKTTVSDLMQQAPVQSVNGQTGDVVLSIPAIPVDSVNGKTGTVVLNASDVGALPSSTVIPTKTSDLNNDSGYITAAGAPVQSVAGKTGTVTLAKGDVGLGNVDNVQQYSASNPPPYPVTSVNGMTGAVIVPGGSSMSFGPETLFTVTKYMGIAVLDSSAVWYRISDDNKFIMIGGIIDVTYNITGDVTVFLLSGPVLSGYTDILNYNYSCLCFNSSGNLDIPMMSTMATAAIFRQYNEIKLSVGAPSSTGTKKIIIPPCIFPLDA